MSASRAKPNFDIIALRTLSRRSRRTELRSAGGNAPLRNSHAVSDRVGALSIKMLGANELPLREVGGSAANFNRANRRGTAYGGKSTHAPREVFFPTPSGVYKVGTSARSAEV